MYGTKYFPTCHKSAQIILLDSFSWYSAIATLSDTVSAGTQSSSLYQTQSQLVLSHRNCQTQSQLVLSRRHSIRHSLSWYSAIATLSDTVSADTRPSPLYQTQSQLVLSRRHYIRHSFSWYSAIATVRHSLSWYSVVATLSDNLSWYSDVTTLSDKVSAGTHSAIATLLDTVSAGTQPSPLYQTQSQLVLSNRHSIRQSQLVLRRHHSVRHCLSWYSVVVTLSDTVSAGTQPSPLYQTVSAGTQTSPLYQTQFQLVLGRRHSIRHSLSWYSAIATLSDTVSAGTRQSPLYQTQSQLVLSRRWFLTVKCHTAPPITQSSTLLSKQMHNNNDKQIWQNLRSANIFTRWQHNYRPVVKCILYENLLEKQFCTKLNIQRPQTL